MHGFVHTNIDHEFKKLDHIFRKGRVVIQTFEGRKLDTVFFVTELINVAYYTLPSGYVFNGEQHDFWEIGYVERGRFCVNIDGKDYVLEAGDMDICKPNVFHTSKTVGDEPVNVLVLAFDGELLNSQVFDKRILRMGEEERRCLDTIIREAARTYSNFKGAPGAVNLVRKENSPFGSEQILKNRLEELFVYIYRHNSGEAEEKEQDTSTLSQRVQEYISAHYGEKLTLQTLADVHSISVTHLKRLFKEQAGMTVLAYLTQVRIREAKRLILEGKLNFSQIAQKVGYDSIYYFSEVFKKKTGMTPTQYAQTQSLK